MKEKEDFSAKIWSEKKKRKIPTKIIEVTMTQSFSGLLSIGCVREDWKF